MDTNKKELDMNELEAANGGWDLKSLWEGFKNLFSRPPKKEQKKDDEPGGCKLTGGDLWKP